MKSSLFLSTLAVALTWTSVAGGAPPSAGPSAATQQFASCAVQKYDGAEMLATQPGSDEESEVLAEFARKGCAPPSNDSQALRGALAEQLFKADFGSIGARPKRETIEVFTFDTSELASLDAEGRKRLYLAAFGACVASVDSTRSVGLLQTAAGSADEARIISELKPALSPCLNEGERLDLGKAELRGLLAEGVYRMALALTLDGAVVVTGTRDPSGSVTCKNLNVTGTRLKQQVCLTAAQWKTRELQDEYSNREAKRRADLYNEMKSLCEAMVNWGEGGGTCLMR
jgi:hypothetical protein